LNKSKKYLAHRFIKKCPESQPIQQIENCEEIILPKISGPQPFFITKHHLSL
jgi:hypothetical protein